MKPMNPIDEKLNSFSQAKIAEAVRSLPDEELSMAWRSGLNSRILEGAASQRKKRLRMNFLWKPAFGLSLACTLAVTVIFRSPAKTIQAGDSIEIALLRHHQEAALPFDMASFGLSPIEATNSESTISSVKEWTETDLESL